MFHLKSLPILALALLLQACALPDQIDTTKKWSANKLYTEAKAALEGGDYEQAIDYYQKLEARYPFGLQATQGQLDICYAHYKNNEPDSAISAADRFIKLHPQNPHVDYAYYLKGLANYQRNQSFASKFMSQDISQRDAGSAMSAFNDFAELVRLYPDSRYTPDARQRMIFLRSNMAKYQLHVARYYMKRGAYLAAANRANRVVRTFQRTDSVTEALEIMIEAYGKLGLKTLQEDAKRVLSLNTLPKE
jgi:outer membrane protein assembly factor BamD